MSWLTQWIPTFFAPKYAWLFLLAIPVIIFYFLKLRRTRIAISSLALWQQVINDQRVNAPFQKFKRNMLLFLQLLLLSLLALAAMQPFWRGDSERLTYLPILIDCSASMGAVDAEGTSRLDVAKGEIQSIIDGLLPDQKLTLIAMGSTARRLTEFTDNKTLLTDALKRLEVEQVPSKLTDGLRLAQALSRTQSIETVRLYSDGNLPTRPNPATGELMAEVDFDLPFTLDFFQIDLPGNNIGITALNARRSSPERWDIFIRIEGTASASTEAELVLTSNGEPVGEERVILNAGESQRLVFSVDARTDQALQASLKPVGLDALAADDSAWLNLPKGREIDVYCPTNMKAFRHALESLPGVLVYPRADAVEPANEYDLVISDNKDDIARETPLSIFIGVLPDDLASLISIQDEPAEVVDWERDAQILQHVQLKEVIISEMPVKNEGISDVSIEDLGYSILAHGTQGPLIVSQRVGIGKRYFLLFHTDRSTLPYRVGFPVFIANAINEAMQFASLSDIRAPSTGVLPAQVMNEPGTYRVTTPEGRHEERSTDADGVLKGISAPEVGEYQIRKSGDLVAKIGVSLLNPTESRLETVDTITFNELSVEAEQQTVQQDAPLWTWFAAAGFIVLLFEWWYFQRRPVGVPE
ncbi:hypothetical protein KOR42_30240 [Thalassoglobus neptunius]|uniref:VWFA domain-containing protein n=1 Tax=Thalassoglobus neptunius TaxID=1938619 RepID=A0A5C5WNX4_9PLAN|nr:BatA and WFA domain-containing protein [Thalassoglobus neptunius]TWT52338.1 hypothetical protein KOR42_30240 [Thalassoglobus neptunius]